MKGSLRVLGLCATLHYKHTHINETTEDGKNPDTRYSKDANSTSDSLTTQSHNILDL